MIIITEVQHQIEAIETGEHPRYATYRAGAKHRRVTLVVTEEDVTTLALLAHLGGWQGAELLAPTWPASADEGE